MRPLTFGILICALLSFQTAYAAEKESAYDRIMRTNTLRCAYIVYPPETIKDPNTGTLSGTVYDTVEMVGKLLDWKIEWVAEVGFADMFDGLKTGKYDALCSGLWESPSRARHALFSLPTNYGIYHAFVRAQDTRFDKGLKNANAPDIKIAVIDGEYGETVAKESFPLAGLLSLPQLSDISQLLESVATEKADIVFLQKTPAQGYLASHPGKIKIVDGYPVRVMPAPPFAFAVGEHDLKALIDSTLTFMINGGEIESILRKYDPNLLSYTLISKPYEALQ